MAQKAPHKKHVYKRQTVAACECGRDFKNFKALQAHLRYYAPKKEG